MTSNELDEKIEVERNCDQEMQNVQNMYVEIFSQCSSEKHSCQSVPCTLRLLLKSRIWIPDVSPWDPCLNSGARTRGGGADGVIKAVFVQRNVDTHGAELSKGCWGGDRRAETDQISSITGDNPLPPRRDKSKGAGLEAGGYGVQAHPLSPSGPVEGAATKV